MLLLLVVNLATVLNYNLGLFLLFSIKLEMYVDLAVLRAFLYFRSLSFHAVCNTTKLDSRVLVLEWSVLRCLIVIPW